MYKFKFADIGEGLHEGKVAEVYKKVGDVVQEGDSLFLVETDKVTSAIPSPVTGKIIKVLLKKGETVHVGDDIFYFEVSGDDQEENITKKEEPKSTQPESSASVVGEVKVSNEIIETNFNKTSQTKKPNSKSKGHDGVFTTPLARKVAADKNIDITLVRGSGFNNRVLVKDVLNYKSSPAPFTSVGPTKTPGQTTRIPVSPTRHAIANAMKRSWDNVGYTNLVVEVNMTSLWNQRKSTIATKAFVDKAGVKVTFLPFIVKATTIALHQFPQLNAKYDQNTKELIQYHDKNIGIAVDAPHGLFVPVIQQAETKNLVTIAKEINNLAKKVREKKISSKDMKNGTFSVTNYGSVGALYGVPVINFPEIAILGIGAIIDKVFVGPSGQFVSGKVMHLTLAADHRWVDGADVGRFLTKVKTILENPIMMMEEFSYV